MGVSSDMRSSRVRRQAAKKPNKERTVQVRFSDEELAALDAICSEKKMTRSAFLRSCVEKVQGGDVEPTYIVTRNADAERMASEAKSIGVNVNQIARALNAETKSHPGSLSPGVLGECKTGLEEVRGELSKLTDEVDGLRTDFGIKSDLEPLAEAWVLSCHPDGPSYLPDGTTLADYAATHPEALGTDCAKFEQFPILTKFIDASKNLSIQVHPSNDYALKNEHQYGKTEMWYVLDCVPGAYLYYGFTHEISKEEFAERIKNNTLTEVLNAVPVHKGDCFFIPSGTLHTICQGIVVAEVQQNSNVTYRVYDYGRVGADGKPRALHIEKALDVTRRTPPQKHDFGSHLAQCEYFTVDAKKGAFDGAADEKSFVSLLITDGAGTLTCGGETVKVKKGESYFIPAGSGKYAVTGDCETLVTVV